MTKQSILRQCYLCEEIRDEDEFITRIDDTHYRMCKVCVSDIQSRKAKGKRRNYHTETHRTCYLCLRFLENAEFTQRHADGSYYSACKECNRYVFGHRRRARLLKAKGEYTLQEWFDLLAKHPCCVHCQRRWEDIALPKGWKHPATADHIRPLTKGGANYISNIQPLCRPCNSRKGNRLEKAA